jgi:hypothetical protein
LKNVKRIWIMKRRKLLDSFALLAYLNKEPGFAAVRDAPAAAEAEGGALLGRPKIAL